MRNKCVILIVDDVPSNIQVLVSLLKDDYELKIATDGVRALELAQLEPYPDLVLLDIVMPGMNGYEVLSKLKDIPLTKDIPIIFVTGSTSIEDEEKGLVFGAVDYITKPISPAIVKARVKTHLMIKLQRDELIYNATHDQLTGMNNRHILSQEGPRKFSRAQRQEDTISVIILDIDHFKHVNDKYGHLVGDKILISMAEVLNQDIRNEDFTARFGGEEFIVILENCNAQNAKEIAENLRKKIEDTRTDEIGVTASFGVCEFNKRHDTFESLIKDADTALYRAKHGGRNRVEVYTD